MKKTLKTDSVCNVLAEKLGLEDDECASFVNDVIKDEEINAEPKEEKEKRDKRFVIIVPDPNKVLKDIDVAGYVIERMPTDVQEDGYCDLDGDEPCSREWGELEANNILSVITQDARLTYKKKGPFTCVGDLIDILPKKFLEKHGIKAVYKQPIAIVGVCPDKLYSDKRSKVAVQDSNVSILE